MKRIPVMIQLILTLILVLTIPTTFVTYYSSRSIMQYSETEIAESAVTKLDSNCRLNELALNNVIRNVLQFLKNNRFSDLKNIKNYDDINIKYENVTKAVTFLDSMNDIVDNNNIIYSMFFYMDDSDYIISTDKGIIKVENYENLDWLSQAEEKITGVGGIWYPRNLSTITEYEEQNGKQDGGEIPVISYVYKLNSLTTSIRGTIVANVYEKSINEYLNSNEYGEDTVGFMIDSEGLVVSHEDKDELFQNISREESIQKILQSKQSTGYFSEETTSGRVLYTYYKSTFLDWIYVNTYSMDLLLEKSNAVRMKYMLLTAVIIALGSIFTILFATRFSRPMRELTKSLKEKNGWKEGTKNELAFLKGAFFQLQEQEEDLHKMLREREEGTKFLALHNLLQGEITNDSEREEIQKIFPFSHFIVAIISLDGKNEYLVRTTHEERSYVRFLLSERISECFPEEYAVCCSRYVGGDMAIVMNMEQYDHIKVPQIIEHSLICVKDKIMELMENTASIGVSAVHTGYESVNECVYEASDAVKKRLIKGKDSILFWKSTDQENRKFQYSINREKRIFNYLYMKDIVSIQKEFVECKRELTEYESVSPENVQMIFFQFAGTTIKYLTDHNLSTAKVSGNHSNMYSVIANMDTIDEIIEFLLQIYRNIIQNTETVTQSGEGSYFDQVMKYLQEHYKEDIVFESIAEQIGISYSYIRKLVKEETGKSLIDNLNHNRIEEAKRLLLYSNLSVVQIAKEIGYRNIQSMNRFFKKYEGISPSDYRNTNQHTN